MTHPPERRLRLGVVIASTREGRFGPTVAGWFAEQVQNASTFDLDIIDLAQIEVPCDPMTPQPSAKGDRDERSLTVGLAG